MLGESENMSGGHTHSSNDRAMRRNRYRHRTNAGHDFSNLKHLKKREKTIGNKY